MAAKKVGGGKTPPKPPSKKTPAKKAAAKKPLTAYQKAVMGPAKSAGKGKLQPYDAKWRASVAKNSKRTKVDKVAEGVLKYSPLAGIAYGFEAVTGKSLSGPMNKPAKKANRLSSAANAAMYISTGGAITKAAKTGYKTLKSVRGASEMVSKKTASTKPKGKGVYDAYVNELVAKEIAKMNRATARKKK